MNEKFTFNQVNQQESSAYMNRSGDKPTVLVKRSDGRVTVGRLDKETRSVDFSENGQELVKPGVPLVELSDQRQAELAEELAGKPLRSAEAIKVSERSSVGQKLGTHVVDKLVERPQLSKKEQLSLELDTIAAKYDKEGGLNLWRYGSGMMNMREAQQAGDGQGSMDYQHQAGQAIRELEKVGGAEARKDAETYLRLMQQLHAERQKQS